MTVVVYFSKPLLSVRWLYVHKLDVKAFAGLFATAVPKIKQRYYDLKTDSCVKVCDQ
jgi:hypothetical protein